MTSLPPDSALHRVGALALTAGTAFVVAGCLSLVLIAAAALVRGRAGAPKVGTAGAA